MLKFYVCFGYQFSESYIFGWPVHFSYKFSNDFIFNWTEHRWSAVLATCSMSQSSPGDHLSPSLAHRLPKPTNLAFFKGQEKASSIRTDVHFILVHLSSLVIRIMESVDMNLGKLWEIVRDKEAWHAAVYRVTKSRTQLGDWTTMIRMIQYIQ